jgi:hypothetical protein
MLTYGLWYVWHRGRQCTWRCVQVIRKGWFTCFSSQIISYVITRATLPKFKLLITFYQMVVALPDLYGVDLPLEYCKPPLLCQNPTARLR